MQSINTRDTQRNIAEGLQRQGSTSFSESVPFAAQGNSGQNAPINSKCAGPIASHTSNVAAGPNLPHAIDTRMALCQPQTCLALPSRTVIAPVSGDL